MSAIRGPASFSSNDDGNSFLIAGFNDAPRVYMSYTLPYYNEYARRFSFRKVMDLCTPMRWIRMHESGMVCRPSYCT